MQTRTHPLLTGWCWCNTGVGQIVAAQSSGNSGHMTNPCALATLAFLRNILCTLNCGSLGWTYNSGARSAVSAAQCADVLGGAGVVPMLAAPMPGNNDNMMQEAVSAAAKRGLVQPNDHVVCVMSIKDSLVVKVVTMDSIGTRTMRHTDSLAGENGVGAVQATLACFALASMLPWV